MKARICLAVGVALMAWPALSSAQRAGPAQTQQLTDEVAAADQAFFSAFFDRCDLPTLAKMVTDDLEMFHDKNGYMTKTGKEFLDGIAGTCARQKTGEDYRSRRELVPGTLKVYPLNNYGAVEVGVHRFYPVVAGQAGETGRGLAVHARLEEGRERLEAGASAELRSSTDGMN